MVKYKGFLLLALRNILLVFVVFGGMYSGSASSNDSKDIVTAKIFAECSSALVIMAMASEEKGMPELKRDFVEQGGLWIVALEGVLQDVYDRNDVHEITLELAQKNTFEMRNKYNINVRNVDMSIMMPYLEMCDKNKELRNTYFFKKA